MTATLRIILRASALYDLLALVLLLAMPGWLFDLFAHPVPESAFLFRLAALPLWVLPVVYWLASLESEAGSRLVSACVLLRVIGAVGIAAIVLWHRPAGAMAYWSFVIGDLVWAALIHWQRSSVSSTARSS